jgi:hypothetical protein
MTKDFKTAMLALSFGLPLFLMLFIAALYFGSCGFGAECTYRSLPAVIHTPIPTLAPAWLPTPEPGGESASAGKCTVEAETLLSTWVRAGYPESEPFTFTDLNGAACEATFADVRPLFGEANLWYSGALACASCHNVELSAASAQLDLSSYAGILAGSRRAAPEAVGNDILGGGDWEQSLLNQQLFVLQKMPFGRPAGAVAERGPVILAGRQVAPAGTEADEGTGR